MNKTCGAGLLSTSLTIGQEASPCDLLSPALGESLYLRGFVDVDCTSSMGLTLLMFSGNDRSIRPKAALQRFSWLISRGADLGRKVNPPEHICYDPSTVVLLRLIALVSG